MRHRAEPSGFAYTDDKNVRRGFDVDLGDADKAQFSPLFCATASRR